MPGVAIGAGLNKAIELVRGGPQKLQQMAAEQVGIPKWFGKAGGVYVAC